MYPHFYGSPILSFVERQLPKFFAFNAPSVVWLKLKMLRMHKGFDESCLPWSLWRLVWSAALPEMKDWGGGCGGNFTSGTSCQLLSFAQVWMSDDSSSVVQSSCACPSSVSLLQAPKCQLCASAALKFNFLKDQTYTFTDTSSTFAIHSDLGRHFRRMILCRLRMFICLDY